MKMDVNLNLSEGILKLTGFFECLTWIAWKWKKNIENLRVEKIMKNGESKKKNWGEVRKIIEVFKKETKENIKIITLLQKNYCSVLVI